MQVGRAVEGAAATVLCACAQVPLHQRRTLAVRATHATGKVASGMGELGRWESGLGDEGAGDVGQGRRKGAGAGAGAGRAGVCRGRWQAGQRWAGAGGRLGQRRRGLNGLNLVCWAKRARASTNLRRVVPELAHQHSTIHLMAQDDPSNSRAETDRARLCSSQATPPIWQGLVGFVSGCSLPRSGFD